MVLEESEETFVHNDVITGNENIVARLQGEVAFNVGVKGFRYEPAGNSGGLPVMPAGINPDDTVLANSNVWTAVMDDVKDYAGAAFADALSACTQRESPSSRVVSRGFITTTDRGE